MAMSGSKRGNHDGRQQAVALGLAAGLTVKAAAAQAKVAYRTARLWLDEDEDFQALVHRFRSEVLEMAMSRLTAATTKAAKVLKGLLESKDEKTRLNAATRILELSMSMRGTLSIEQRLQALEARQRRAKRP
jgi:hypothetical protein